MSFSFGFDLSTALDGRPVKHNTDDDDKDTRETPGGATATTDEQLYLASRHHLLPFHWIDNLGELLAQRQEDQLVCDEIHIGKQHQHDDGSSVTAAAQPSIRLRRVDLARSTFQRAAAVATKESFATTELQSKMHGNANDLIPGVYEGGLKVWESCLDLIEYMHNEPASALPWLPSSRTTRSNPQRIQCLELGCGHGLPLCYVLRQVAAAKGGGELDRVQLYAVDYNDYVLRDAFVSNVVLNMAAVHSDNHHHQKLPPQLAKRIQMGAGDWYGLLQQQEENETTQGSSSQPPLLHQMDWIAAAETLYSVQAAHETAVLISRLLRPETGLAWVASKRYYFGVGGGVDAFVQAAQVLPPTLYNGDAYQLVVKTIQVYDNGKANIRELLRVQLQKVS